MDKIRTKCFQDVNMGERRVAIMRSKDTMFVASISRNAAPKASFQLPNCFYISKQSIEFFSHLMLNDELTGSFLTLPPFCLCSWLIKGLYYRSSWWYCIAMNYPYRHWPLCISWGYYSFGNKVDKDRNDRREGQIIIIETQLFNNDSPH